MVKDEHSSTTLLLLCLIDIQVFEVRLYALMDVILFLLNFRTGEGGEKWPYSSGR